MWEGPLEKITDYKFRIPKSYKQGMLVDGIIYANEKLLSDIKKDNAPEQVANVAFLPGIVNYSLAMPDIHWGYGFCIGGVAATDPQKGGVISPGGVGYDINCLAGNSLILNELGYRLKIKDYEDNFSDKNLVCIDFKESMNSSARIRFFMKRKSVCAYKLVTASGREIIATADHPFYAKDGMQALGNLSQGQEVAIYPFEGIDYQKPSTARILDEEDVKLFLSKMDKGGSGNAEFQILRQIKEKGLLPLRYDSYQLPYLIKIMGYCFGDGTIYFTNNNGKGVVCFYGDRDDLKDIKSDLEKAGLNAGQIYSRQRTHKITTAYRVYRFKRREFVLKVTSSALASLMGALGVPVGNKCKNKYFIPGWLRRAPLWQKRLFLAGLFGAELTTPTTVTGHGRNFYCPVFSMNKTKKQASNAIEFLREISKLLSEFNVTTRTISSREENIAKDGNVSERFRLIIEGTPENLIRLYGRVGFEYNHKRRFLANLSVQYLRLKSRLTAERQTVALKATALHSEKGLSPSKILNNFSDVFWVNRRFIERSIYEGRTDLPHVGNSFFAFGDFIKKATEGLGNSGMVWDRVECTEKLENFTDFVYDFTVAHHHHNFIANNFVVSNCGVRLLKTNLTFADVKDKINPLVDTFYREIPSGVGSKGEIKVSQSQEKKILLEGAQWVVAQGMGVKEDLDCCEENGAIEGADPDSVSKRAYERGMAQTGTLGSGNHFLEAQFIEKIFDEDAAQKLGLFPGQVTVMIHSGSRGLGFQVCEDYLQVMVKCLSKYGINIPDRQLACAPVQSPEAKNYIGAMRAAANYAWANRQALMHLARMSFEKVFSKSWQSLGMDLIYDVAHNIAKFEEYTVDGEKKVLCVHRKGATRAFGPGNAHLSGRYRDIGQPVIIPGDMGRASYLLLGTKKAENETFGSTCHGAGRLKSRHEAIRTGNLDSLISELRAKGIEVRAEGARTIVEEAPSAYKDVDDVVSVVDAAGLSTKVCRMKPLCVLKG
ncbi:MAG: intein-containing RctB family protein [Candidatus Omnitrophica bacterium]|nr:intein-containing RctB family protein [Candidatus Omnitrophota bacterium]